MISAEDITKSFGNLQVLKGISLEITAGEVVSVVGASGAGKTTLLQILGPSADRTRAMLRSMVSGPISLNGNKLARFRNMHIGFVFQFHQLLPEFNAHENVCIPGFIANRPRREVETEGKGIAGFPGIVRTGWITSRRSFRAVNNNV